MDERALRVLEEIRELHREHLELYRGAVRNQEASIRMQEEAVQMQRVAMRRIIPLIVGIIVVVLIGWAVLAL